MDVLEIKDLKKIYKIQSEDGRSEEEVEILKGINLNIKEGEYVSIVGPSGSGKSTLMQIMGLLDSATHGSIRFLGKDVTKMNDNEISDLRRNYIGFVFQFFNLLPKTTALDNVNLPLLYSRRGDKNKASRLLDMVGLSNRKGHKPNQLSGGQQQRVAIARALVNDPKIIFADEPTGNISQAQSQEVMDYFSKLNEAGVTIVLITHDPKVAAQAKRIITIVDGRIESDVVNSNFKSYESVDEKIEEETNKIEDKIENKIVIDNEKRSRFSNFIRSIVSIMNFSFLKENISVALKSLSTNKFRTFLSTLGITIGIASVVAMISLGEGAKEEIRKQYEDTGTNTIQIQANWYARTRSSYINIKDYKLIKKLQDRYPIEYVSRSMFANSSEVFVVSYLDKKFTLSSPNNTFFAEDSDYAKITNYKFLSGSFFTKEQEDSSEKVCVIATTIYKNLFDKNEDPIGKKITISRTFKDNNGKNVQIRSLFKIVGLLDLSWSDQYADNGETVIIPYSTGENGFLGKKGKIIPVVNVRIKDIKDIDYMKDVLTEKLAEIRGIKNIKDIPEKERPLMIRTATDIIGSLAKSSGIMNKLLLFIASISLLVGGNGIMNIMIVSVKRRTREIGLRKALGARKLDILFQFITEAIVIGLLGGVTGIILGIIVSLIISIWLASILSWSMVIISFAFSFGIALFFGYLPAKRAAKLSPVEALRYE